MCVNNARECVQAMIIKDWATRISDAEHERTGIDTNTYRHTLWQARLTAELGENRAIAWADAHEAYLFAGQERDHKSDLSTIMQRVEKSAERVAKT
ncbi:DUF6973 domain-containing protein [Streptomyces sp. NPDC002886]|uniref:DUF6973 domain-containing protein n=1 Tax=Streptomyces sp. NPDC002886 TaxID=3364667 RepID=UPI00369B543B